MCKNGKAQFSVSLVDNGEEERRKPRLKPSLVNVFMVREKDLLLPRTFVMIRRTCYKRTWSSPLPNIKRPRERRKISETHLEKQKDKEEGRVWRWHKRQFVRLFVVGVGPGSCCTTSLGHIAMHMGYLRYHKEQYAEVSTAYSVHA